MIPSIENISNYFIDGQFVATVDEQRLAGAIYRLLATGSSATPEAIATASGWPVGAVEERVGAWPGVFRDNDGAVLRFWAHAADPVSNHRMDIEGLGTSWGWCAYDTLFIPLLLGTTARVTSRCPTTGEEIRLMVSPDGVSRVEPGAAVISLLTPDIAFDDHVMTTLCHFIHFFSSPAAADAWIGDHPDTFRRSLEDAFEVGRRMDAAVFPTLLGTAPAGT